jgi:hypothetical protein
MARRAAYRRDLVVARPAGRQLGEGKRKRLVLVATGLLRRGDPPTPFAREGWLIAAVRSAIILSGGWTWKDADRAARDVVHEALRAIGAKRPEWDEAHNPHYAQAGTFTLYERTRCRQCGWKLPEENKIYCTERCRSRYITARWRAEQAAFAAMAAEAL